MSYQHLQTTLYTKSNSDSSYTTESLKENYGPITEIEILNNGGGYTGLPKTKVISGLGTDVS